MYYLVVQLLMPFTLCLQAHLAGTRVPLATGTQRDPPLAAVRGPACGAYFAMSRRFSVKCPYPGVLPSEVNLQPLSK